MFKSHGRLLFYLIIVFCFFITLSSVCASEISDISSGETHILLNNITSDSGHINVENVAADVSNNSYVPAKGDLLSSPADTNNASSKGVHIVFEGYKVYGFDDKYNVKVLDENNNPVTKGSVSFFVMGIFFNNTKVNNQGIASCWLPFIGNYSVMSVYHFESSYDYVYANENVTLNALSSGAMDKSTLGANYPRWSGADYKICADGYRAQIGKNLYHLIKFNGARYIIYNATVDSLYLNKILGGEIQCDIAEINLIKNQKYHLSHIRISDQEWDYCSCFNYGQLIIHGNGAILECGDEHGNNKGKLNFMFVGREGNVVLEHLSLSYFNHCFINQGHILCDSVTFLGNQAYKFDVYEPGGVIHNYNTAYFRGCAFLANSAKTAIGLYTAGGVLYAEPYSTTVFDRCHIDNTEHDAIEAKEYSMTVFYQKIPLNYEQISGCSFDEKAFLSVISSDVFESPNKTVKFVCKNKNELMNALCCINTLTPGMSVEIDLKNGEYEFSHEDFESYKKHPTNNFASSFWRHNFYDGKFNFVTEEFMLNVGIVPITINGNGATIKRTGDKNDDDHFALIPRGCTLTITNTKFTGFNTVFHNYGNLVLNNCYFKKNIIHYNSWLKGHGGVLFSDAGTTTFNGCTFSGNQGEDTDAGVNTDICYLINSAKVTYNRCIENSDEDKLYDDHLFDGQANTAHTNEKAVTTNSNIKYSVVKHVPFKLLNLVDDKSISTMKKSLKGAVVDYLVVNMSCDISCYMLYEILEFTEVAMLRSNGHDLKSSGFNDYFLMTIYESKIIYFEGFTFSDLGVFSNNVNYLYFYNCTFSNLEKTTIKFSVFYLNKGLASFVNCNFVNIYASCLFRNEGILSFTDCVFSDNKVWTSLIYNNRAPCSIVNCIFKNNKGIGVEVSTFGDLDTVVVGCTPIKVISEHPMANWKMDLIKSGFFVATALAGGAVGYALGAIAPVMATMSFVMLSGAAVGMCFGAIYAEIEACNYRDYSNRWNNIWEFAGIGSSAAVAGFSLAMIKYYSPHVEVAQENNMPGEGIRVGGEGDPNSANNPRNLNDGFPGREPPLELRGPRQVRMIDIEAENTNINVDWNAIKKNVNLQEGYYSPGYSTTPSIGEFSKPTMLKDPFSSVELLRNTVFAYLASICQATPVYLNLFENHARIALMYMQTNNNNYGEWLNLFFDIDDLYNSIRESILIHTNSNQINPHFNPDVISNQINHNQNLDTSSNVNPNPNNNVSSNSAYANTNLYIIAHDSVFNDLIQYTDNVHYNNMTHLIRVFTVLTNFDNLNRFVRSHSDLRSQELMSHLNVYLHRIRYIPNSINNFLDDRHVSRVNSLEMLYRNAVAEWNKLVVQQNNLQPLMNMNTSAVKMLNYLKISGIESPEFTQMYNQFVSSFNNMLVTRNMIINNDWASTYYSANSRSNTNPSESFFNLICLYNNMERMFYSLNKPDDNKVFAEMKSCDGLSCEDITAQALIILSQALKLANSTTNGNKTALIKGIDGFYNKFNNEMTTYSKDIKEGVLSALIAYNTLIHNLNSLFSKYCTTQDINVTFNKNDNAYDYIFNLPNAFPDEHEVRQFVNELLILKKIDPELYAKVMKMDIFKGLLDDNQYDLTLFLRNKTIKELNDTYMKIKAILSPLRSGKVNSTTMLMESLKYRGYSSLTTELAYDGLNPSQRTEICNILLLESRKLLLNYHGNDLADKKNQINKLSKIDLNNVSNKNFNEIITAYNLMWSYSITSNPLENINPDMLSCEDLGKLIIKNLAKLILASGDDTRVRNRLPSLWISFNNVYFNGAYAEILHYVQENSDSSKKKLIQIFNEVKDAFDFQMIFDYHTNIVAGINKNKMDINVYLKNPKNYNFYVNALSKIKTKAQFGLSGDVNIRYLNKLDDKLHIYSDLFSADCIKLLVDLHNYLMEDHTMDEFKEFADKRISMFENTIFFTSKSASIHKYLDIASILHSGKYLPQKIVDYPSYARSFVGAWEKITNDYPDVAYSIQKDCIKGNPIDLIKIHGNYFKVLDWILLYLYNDYFKLGDLNFGIKNDFNVIDKKPTSNLDINNIIKLFEKSLNDAVSYCDALTKGNNYLHEKLFADIYNIHRNCFVLNLDMDAQADINKHVEAYNQFVDELNKLFDSYLNPRNVKINVSSNVYDNIFNLPNYFAKNVVFSTVQLRDLLTKEIWSLNSINPEILKNKNIKNIMNIDNIKDYSSLSNWMKNLKSNELYCLYDNIFKQLDEYRNNTDIRLKESNVIMDSIKYRVNWKVFKNGYYNSLDEKFINSLYNDLLKETGKMLCNDYYQPNDLYIQYKDLCKNVLNITKERFDSLINLYYALWQKKFNPNNLNGINPNSLSTDNLGKLIINNLANIILLSGEDEKIQRYLPSFKMDPNNKIYLAYGISKILKLVEMNNDISKKELINMFNQLKDAYDISIINDYVSSCISKGLTVDADSFKKFPNQYDYISSLLFENMYNDLMNFGELGIRLMKYAHICSEDAMLFSVDIFNLVNNNPNKLEERLKIFEDNLKAQGKYELYAELASISSIVFSETLKPNDININPLYQKFYGSWEKLKSLYPAISDNVYTNLFNGNIDAFLSKYGNNYARKMLFNFIFNYLSKNHKPLLSIDANAIYKDIERIMMSEPKNKNNEMNIINEKDDNENDMEIDDLIDSLKTINEKYPDISLEIDNKFKSLDKSINNLNQYYNKYGGNKTRETILGWIFDYLLSLPQQANNIPKQENDYSKENAEKFKDINKILNDKTADAFVIQTVNIDGYTNLYACWMNLDVKYSDIADYVSNNLFNNQDLSVYVKKIGNCNEARFNIINCIKIYLLGNNADLINIDNGNDINPKDIDLNNIDNSNDINPKGKDIDFKDMMKTSLVTYYGSFSPDLKTKIMNKISNELSTNNLNIAKINSIAVFGPLGMDSAYALITFCDDKNNQNQIAIDINEFFAFTIDDKTEIINDVFSGDVKNKILDKVKGNPNAPSIRHVKKIVFTNDFNNLKLITELYLDDGDILAFDTINCLSDDLDADKNNIINKINEIFNDENAGSGVGKQDFPNLDIIEADGLYRLCGCWKNLVLSCPTIANFVKNLLFKDSTFIEYMFKINDCDFTRDRIYDCAVGYFQGVNVIDDTIVFFYESDKLLSQQTKKAIMGEFSHLNKNTYRIKCIHVYAPNEIKPAHAIAKYYALFRKISEYDVDLSMFYGYKKTQNTEVIIDNGVNDKISKKILTKILNPYYSNPDVVCMREAKQISIQIEDKKPVIKITLVDGNVVYMDPADFFILDNNGRIVDESILSSFMKNFVNSFLDVKDKNPFNNIFNYKNHFEKLMNINYIKAIISRDMDALKVIHLDLYNEIISELNVDSFEEWLNIHFNEPDFSQLCKNLYNEIFDKLNQYRSNTALLKSESSRLIDNIKHFNWVLYHDYHQFMSQAELKNLTDYYYEISVQLLTLLKENNFKLYNDIFISYNDIFDNYANLNWTSFECVDWFLSATLRNLISRVLTNAYGHSLEYSEEDFKLLSVNEMATFLKQNMELIYKTDRTFFTSLERLLQSDYLEFNNYVDNIVTFDKDAKSKLISIYECIKYFTSIQKMIVEKFSDALDLRKTVDYDMANLCIGEIGVEGINMLISDGRVKTNGAVMAEMFVPFNIEFYNEFVSNGTYKMDVEKLFKDVSIDNKKLRIFQCIMKAGKRSISEFDVLRLYYKVFKWNQTCIEGYNSLMNKLKAKYNIGSIKELNGILVDGVLHVYTDNGGLVKYSDLYSWVSNEILNYINDNKLLFDRDSYSYKNPNVNPIINVAREINLNEFSLAEIEKIIYSTDYKPTIYRCAMREEVEFFGAWEEFGTRYKDVATIVELDLFKGSILKYLESAAAKNNGEISIYDQARKMIIDYLKEQLMPIPDIPEIIPNIPEVNPNIPNIPEVNINNVEPKFKNIGEIKDHLLINGIPKKEIEYLVGFYEKVNIACLNAQREGMAEFDEDDEVKFNEALGDLKVNFINLPDGDMIYLSILKMLYSEYQPEWSKPNVDEKNILDKLEEEIQYYIPKVNPNAPKVNPNAPKVNPDALKSYPKLIPVNDEGIEFKPIIVTRGDGIPVKEVNIGLKNFTNVYEGIFNLPILFEKGVGEKQLNRIFYHDLMLLKLYDYNLYMDALRCVFKNVRTGNEAELSSFSSFPQLNYDQLYSAYIEIFILLGSCRDNVKISLNQKAILIDKLKYDHVFSDQMRDNFYPCLKSSIPEIAQDLLINCEELIKDYKGFDLENLKASINKYKNMDLTKISEPDFNQLCDLYYKLWHIDGDNNYFADVDISKLNIKQLGDLIIRGLSRFSMVFDAGDRNASSDIFIYSDSYLSYCAYYVSYLVELNTLESEHELIEIFYNLKKAYDICSHSLNIKNKVDNNEQIDVNSVLKYSNKQYYNTVSQYINSKTKMYLIYIYYISSQSADALDIKNNITALINKYSDSSSPFALAYYVEIYNIINHIYTQNSIVSKMMDNNKEKKHLNRTPEELAMYNLNMIKIAIESLNTNTIELDNKYYNLNGINPSHQEVSVDLNNIDVKHFKFKNYKVKYKAKQLQKADERNPLVFKFVKEYNIYAAYDKNGNMICSNDYYINQKNQKAFIIGGHSYEPNDVVYTADGKAILAKDMEYMNFHGGFSVDMYGRPYYASLNDVPETKFVPGQMYYYANGNLALHNKIVVTEDGFVRDVEGNRIYSHHIGDKYESGVKYYTFNGKLVDAKNIRVDDDGFVHDCHGNLLFKQPLKGNGFPNNFPSWALNIIVNGQHYVTA